MKDFKDKGSKLKIILVVILLFASVLSFTVAANRLSDPETYSGTVAALDEKEALVAKMSIASIAAASAIDLIPGDAGQSVSKALVELGGYFVLLLAAIYLEKLLLTVGGFAAFKLFLPIGFLALAVFLISQKSRFKEIGVKLITFGIVLFLLVPSSVWVSQKAEQMHEASSQSVEATIDSMEEDSTTIQENATDGSSSGIMNFFKKAKTSAAETVEKYQNYLKKLIDDIAFFFVTTVVIPLVVLLILYILIKQLLGIGGGDLDYSKLSKELRSITQKQEE
ncbi:MAG: hypothetical protein IJH77_04860 [Mogibacterium sp.]|nr:hypothetical protein [Mogibacterium sp.]